jgi:hypothetical protein
MGEVVVDVEAQSDILIAELGGEGREGFGRGDSAVGGAIQRDTPEVPTICKPETSPTFRMANSMDTFPFSIVGEIVGTRASDGMTRLYQFLWTVASTGRR